MPDPAAPDNPALRTLHAVQLLTDALDRVHSDLTRRMEMHTSDLRALRMLAIREQHDETVTPQAIAEHLAITTAAATSLIDRLVRDGFVERARHPEDGRSRIITLTPKARQHFFAHFGQHLGTVKELIETTETEDLDTIAGFLESLSAHITQPDASAHPDAGRPSSSDADATSPLSSKDVPTS